MELIISERTNRSFKEIPGTMNNIQMSLNAPVWKGVVWDGKKIINRVNTNLIRLIILKLVSDELLSDAEEKQLIELFIGATNYNGNMNEVLEKITN